MYLFIFTKPHLYQVLRKPATFTGCILCWHTALRKKCMWEKVNNDTNITNIYQVTDKIYWPWSLQIDGLMQDCGNFVDDYSSYCSIEIS